MECCSYIWILYSVLQYGLLLFYLDSIFYKKCADNPWGGKPDTFEWKTTSPPPFHTYDELQNLMKVAKVIIRVS